MDEARQDVKPSQLQRYSLLESHCKVIDGGDGCKHISSYQVEKLSCMRVFFVFTGTVLQDPVLWAETSVLVLVFVPIFLLTYSVHWRKYDDFASQEDDIRSFVGMLTTLVGLLLSFYTALQIKRWWEMRVLGVGSIWQAASTLTMLISQGCTRDPEVLSAVRRYAVASLVLLFMRRRGQGENLYLLHERGVLTVDEVEKLRQLRPEENHSEAIWVWLANLATQLHRQGLTAGPPHYCQLLHAVDVGRGGAALVNAYVETQVPMTYVHLLGLMVKLHNVMLTVLMSLLSVRHAKNDDQVSLFRTVFRSFFMPFLYNAILLINNDLADPFSGDLSDFPMSNLCHDITVDSKGYVDAGDHLPAWILEGRKYEGV